jgi:hypothetical protein
MDRSRTLDGDIDAANPHPTGKHNAKYYSMLPTNSLRLKNQDSK